MLATALKIFIWAFVLAYFFFVLFLLKRKALNLKYTLLWLFTGFVMVVMLIFPGLLQIVSKMIGVYDPVNGLFVLVVFFIMLILLSITSIVSRHNAKIRTLIQTVAQMEKRIRELEKLQGIEPVLEDTEPITEVTESIPEGAESVTVDAEPEDDKSSVESVGNADSEQKSKSKSLFGFFKNKKEK